MWIYRVASPSLTHELVNILLVPYVVVVAVVVGVVTSVVIQLRTIVLSHPLEAVTHPYETTQEKKLNCVSSITSAMTKKFLVYVTRGQCSRFAAGGGGVSVCILRPIDGDT